jgi:TonB family protein
MPEAILPDGTPRELREVRLVLTIGSDGGVLEVEVTAGVGAPWDEAAVNAARKFRFTPALSDGQPIAVKVPFTYVFRKPERRGRIVPTRVDRRELEPAPGYVVAGVVVERGTRTPQAGVAVLVRDPRTGQTTEALTDGDGRFVAYGLGRGRLKVEVFTSGFEPFETSTRVAARSVDEARENGLRIALEPSGSGANRTVVREARPPEAASEIDLTEDELTKVAGTFGDPTRVVATLPGVARSPFGLGYYVVRGAQFDNTGFFIDGHPAVYLYHLLGGPGVIHPELVGELSFYPGGYPARFGRVASGVVSVETKDPPRDRWHLDVEVDVFKAGLLVSTPFDGGRGVASLALRRSYYDLLLPLFTDDISLSYTDYQARVAYDFSERVRGRFVALGAMDSVETAGVDTSDGGGTSSTNLGLGFHRLNIALEVDLTKTLSILSSAMWEYDFIENRRVAEGDTPIDANTSGWIGQLITTLKWQPTKRFRLDAGLDLAYIDVSADLSIPSSPPLGDPRPPIFDPLIVDANIHVPYASVAPFLSADVNLGRGLRLLPGLRLNLDDYGDRLVASVDPKLAVRWQVSPSWTFKAMGAMAHQPPQVFQIGEPFGDPSIPPVSGTQASLGFEWKPTPSWLVSLEGFVQHIDDLVRPSDRIAGEEGALDRVFWDADLEGRAFGAELLIRKEFGDWVYGWLSYTLSRAERLRPPKDWALFELDQTHVLNLAWTFRLGREWSLGARFQLASGNPYYPIVGARYDADQDSHVPTYAAASGRLPVYHRLDLRLDKTWRFDEWLFELFLDIQNAYNASNPETPRYSYDFRKRTDGVSLPFLPSIGFRMVF